MCKMGIMSNHLLNLGPDPDSGSIRRAAVVPHNLRFEGEPREPHERQADDNMKDDIKSGHLMPQFFHILGTLQRTLDA